MDADEVFDRILHFNRMKFLKLLAALEEQEGDLVLMLRRMARFQLEAMSNCIGSRELDAPVVAAPADEHQWSIRAE